MTTTTELQQRLEDLGIELMRLSDVPNGEFVKRTYSAKEIYTKCEYDRTSKKYCLEAESDISKVIYLKGSTVVFVGFTY